MTIRKTVVMAGVVLLAGGWGMLAQAQVQHPLASHGYGVAGALSRQAHRAPSAPVYRSLPSGASYRSVPYRPPMAVAPYALPRYRQPAVIVSPTILIGSVLPYGYGGDYPIDNWGDYNLPAPCCGQYWVQYGQSFLLVSPDGVVLQVLTP